MNKRLLLLIMILSFAKMSYSLERHSGTLTQARLRAQEQNAQDEQLREFREGKMHDGVRTILEFVPMCAVGAGICANGIYKLHNFENKCWVQPVQSVTPELCNLLKQVFLGGALCVISGGYFGLGCQDLCDSEICTQEQCCCKCCTLCAQECCGLLGMRR